MDTRKIQLVGSRSYAITLPKQWAKLNRLKNHDTVFIQTTPSNELLIKKTDNQKQTPKSISLTVENKDTLIEFLVFCFYKNIDHITLNFPVNDYQSPMIIRQALKYLEGYEITQEDEKTIEISFLFHDVNITIPKLIMRMYYLIKLQLSSLQAKNIVANDDAEIATDRLFHLSTKIFFSCLHNATKWNDNEIQNYEDLFFVHIISKRLENISDNLCKLKDREINKNEFSQLIQLIEFLGILLSHKNPASKLKKRLMEINIAKKDTNTNSIIQKVKDLIEDVFEAKISIEFNNKIMVGITDVNN